MIKLLNNKKGAAAILMALMVVTISGLLFTALPNKSLEFAKTNRNMQTRIFNYAILADAAMMLAAARGAGYYFNEAAGLDCNTVAGYGGIQLSDSGFPAIPHPFQGQICHPKDPPGFDIDTQKSIFCFDNKMRVSDNSQDNDICIDVNDFHVQLDKQGNEYTAQIVLQKFDKMKLHAKLKLQPLLNLFKNEFEPLPQAHAQQSLAPTPNGFSVSLTNYRRCDAIAQNEDHILCQSCTIDPVGAIPAEINNNATCIRFSLCVQQAVGGCDPALENLRLYQRIIVFGPTSDNNG